MIDCAFCDSPATDLDTDMDMWLCSSCWGEMNNVPQEIDIDEVW